MTVQGNVAELIDGQTHHAWMWNEKNMHYWTNKSGAAVASGDVVVQDTANVKAFKATTTEADVMVAGVIPQKDDVDGAASNQTIANDSLGMVQFVGDIGKVNVENATAIGDYMVASSTAKKAKSVGATWRPGVFARATSAGEGTVSAWLFPAHSQNAPWSPGNYKLHGGPTLEAGWLWCDGASYLRTDYAALFAEIGTTYGAADGDHFNVPDFRGRSPVGKGTHADVDSLGDNDGLAVASRTPKHSHTGPSHQHTTLSGSGSDGLGQGPQTGVTGAAGTGATGASAGGYQATNWMIKT